MVVVDSSALIPLAWVGRLDLISTTFDKVRTTTAVREEVLTEGMRGTATLEGFLADVRMEEPSNTATEVASIEGIAEADASGILLAEGHGETLLANDKGLIAVARSHGVESWWVTTLLLRCTKTGELSAEEAVDVLYALVDEGMNLHPKVYAHVQETLRDLGE